MSLSLLLSEGTRSRTGSLFRCVSLGEFGPSAERWRMKSFTQDHPFFFPSLSYLFLLVFWWNPNEHACPSKWAASAWHCHFFLPSPLLRCYILPHSSLHTISLFVLFSTAVSDGRYCLQWPARSLIIWLEGLVCVLGALTRSVLRGFFSSLPIYPFFL